MSKNILIADHAHSLRERLTNILHERGYAVTAVSDGHEADKALARDRFDLMITELKLPGIDGMALLRKAKVLYPLTEVLIISSIDSLQLAVEALKCGACDYLLKPFEIQQVGIIVEKIFEKKKLEREISLGREESSKILELVRRMDDIVNLKKDIIATIAHELNTPITNMGGYVHLLDEEKIGKLTPLQRKAVNSIKEQFKRLERLVKNTVDLIIHKDTIITQSRIDLLRVIDRMIDFVSDDAAKKNIVVQRVCDEAYVRLDVDVERIEEVLYHLLINAIKFNREGGRVTVHVHKKDHHVVIAVQDTGIGIPEREHEKIFDRFYQVDHSITRPYKGAGLGLAIVKLYTELHGGTVSVKSAPGAGSTITITLPFKN